MLIDENEFIRILFSTLFVHKIKGCYYFGFPLVMGNMFTADHGTTYLLPAWHNDIYSLKDCALHCK